MAPNIFTSAIIIITIGITLMFGNQIQALDNCLKVMMVTMIMMMTMMMMTTTTMIAN